MHADKRRDAKVNDMMKAIAIQLRRPSLSDHERLELQHNSYDLKMVSDELVVRYKEQHQNHKDATKKNMLRKQYDKVLKDIDALFAEQKRIKGAMLLPGGNALKAQSKQLENEIRILQIYSGFARRILWERKYGQPIDEWISESFDLYM
ncbi:hypothetical protein BASA60_001389 [Batrachochytrium salamandrivorans]|nr:hypothetical protein BASA60_001389 [Batrachochytrium salamandrivorans]